MNNLHLINNLLNQPNTFSRNFEQIVFLAEEFLSYYECNSSIVGDQSLPDEIRPLLAAISDGSNIIPSVAEVLLAAMLKILLRKTANRLSLGKIGMTAIVRALNRIQADRNNIATAEMCNVVLNTCYDAVNVQLLLDLDGVVPMIRFLRGRDNTITSSALGAIQGICYVPSGRQYIRQDCNVSLFNLLNCFVYLCSMFNF
jgi:hypothetical protein